MVGVLSAGGLGGPPRLDSHLPTNATGVLERCNSHGTARPSYGDRRSGLRVSVLAETPDCP